MVLLGVAAGGRPVVEVGLPAAGVGGGRVVVLVELDDVGDDTFEEGAVVAHHHEGLVAGEDEALQPVETVEVQVVGRLVEEEHVEARQQGRRERHPGRFPARQGRRGLLGERSVESEVGQGGAEAGVEVGAAEREPSVECPGIAVVGPGDPAARRVGGLGQLGLGGGHARTATDEPGDRLLGIAIGFLGQEAHRRLRRRAHDLAVLRCEPPGEEGQERGLAGPVGADEADALPGGDGDVDVDEHRCGPVGEAQAPGLDGGHAGSLPGRPADRQPGCRRRRPQATRRGASCGASLRLTRCKALSTALACRPTSSAIVS